MAKALVQMRMVLNHMQLLYWKKKNQGLVKKKGLISASTYTGGTFVAASIIDEGQISQQSNLIDLELADISLAEIRWREQAMQSSLRTTAQS